MQPSNPKKKRKLNKHKSISIQTDGFQVHLYSAITAYIVFEFMKTTLDTKRKKQIKEQMFSTVEEEVKSNIINSTITIPDQFLEKRYGDKASSRNIYLNICKHHELYHQLKNTFSCLHQKQEFINIKEMLGLISFKSEYTHCLECKDKLQLSDNNGGNICVSYGLNGPEVGLSFEKKCKQCGAKYTYGNYETRYSKCRMKLKDLKYFELSKYTYFEKKLFKLVKYFLFEVHKGFEKYTGLYNEEHEEMITNTAKSLRKKKTLNLGKRKSLKAILECNRLIEAFFLFTLQMELEVVNQRLMISKYKEDELITKKRDRIKLHRNNSSIISSEQSSQESKKSSDNDNFSLTPTELFEYWYEEHQQHINEMDSEILNHVPVHKETGEPFIGHFIAMMDGNAKTVRLVCSYFEEDTYKGMCTASY